LLVNVLKAPIWTVWLWAIIPNAVVAFMPLSLKKTDKSATAVKTDKSATTDKSETMSKSEKKKTA
jgi:hypothetical protein